MGKGTSPMGSSGGSAKTPYEQTVAFIEQNGIPGAIFNYGDETTREIYRAIADKGKLTKEEKAIFNEIRYNAEEGILWLRGGTRKVKGYTKKEIKGAKMFIAHTTALKRNR